MLASNEQDLPSSDTERSVELSSTMERAWCFYMLRMKERFGFWKEKDPRLETLRSIYDKLSPCYSRPKTKCQIV